MSDNSKLNIHTEQAAQSWASNLRSPIKASPSKDKPFSPTVPKAPQFATDRRASMASSVDLTSERGSVAGSPRPTHERKVSGPFGRVPASRPSPLGERKSRPVHESPAQSPARRDTDRFDWATSLRPTTQSHGEGRRRDWSAHSKPLRASSSPVGRPGQQPSTPTRSGMETVPESNPVGAVPASPTPQPIPDETVMPPEPASPMVTGKVGINLPEHYRRPSNIPGASGLKEMPAAGAPTKLSPKKKSVDLSGRVFEVSPPPFATEDQGADGSTFKPGKAPAPAHAKKETQGTGVFGGHYQAVEEEATFHKPGVTPPLHLLKRTQTLEEEEDSRSIMTVKIAESEFGEDEGSQAGSAEDSRPPTSPSNKPLFNPITHEPLPYAANKQFGRGRGHLPASVAAAAQRAPFANDYNTPDDGHQQEEEAPREFEVPDFSTMQAHPTKIEVVDVGEGEEPGETLAQAFAAKKEKKRSTRADGEYPSPRHRRGGSRGKAHFMQPTQAALAHARVPAKIQTSVVVIGGGNGVSSPSRRSNLNTPTAGGSVTVSSPSPLGSSTAAVQSSHLPASSEEAVVVTRSRAVAKSFADSPKHAVVDTPAIEVAAVEAAVDVPEFSPEVPVAAEEEGSRDFSATYATEAELAAPALMADEVVVSAPEAVAVIDTEEEVAVTAPAETYEQHAAEEVTTMSYMAAKTEVPDMTVPVEAPKLEDQLVVEAPAVSLQPEEELQLPPTLQEEEEDSSKLSLGLGLGAAGAAAVAGGVALAEEETEVDKVKVEPATEVDGVELPEEVPDMAALQLDAPEVASFDATRLDIDTAPSAAEELEVTMPTTVTPTAEEASAAAAAGGLTAAADDVEGGVLEPEVEFVDAPEAPASVGKRSLGGVEDGFVVPDANDFIIPEDSNITAQEAGLVTAPAVEVDAQEDDAAAAAAMEAASRGASRDFGAEEAAAAGATTVVGAATVEEIVEEEEAAAVSEGYSAGATATADLSTQAPAAIKTRTATASELPVEALKHTPAGQKLIQQAQVVAQMTVKEAVDQLAAGTVVYKAWVRDGKQKGSTRHVKAKVVNDLVLLTYQSGLAKKNQTVVVIRCCLTIEANRTTLLLETDNGQLAVRPSTPQHETLWALGINAMLHLAEKQDRLNQSEALMDLPWHGIVQGEQ